MHFVIDVRNERARNERSEAQNMYKFLIVWQESDGYVQVHRYTTDNPKVANELRSCAGRTIYHLKAEEYDEDENRIESLGCDLEERVPLIDHSTREPVNIDGQYEVIVTGYALDGSLR